MSPKMHTRQTVNVNSGFHFKLSKLVGVCGSYIRVVIDCNEWKTETATNTQIWVEQNDSNYDGNCTSRHFQSGAYEISGRLISVGQCASSLHRSSLR